MTAHWAHLPHDLLGCVSNRIINQVRGIARVVYDSSGKLPATFEWEWGDFRSLSRLSRVMRGKTFDRHLAEWQAHLVHRRTCAAVVAIGAQGHHQIVLVLPANARHGSRGLAGRIRVGVGRFTITEQAAARSERQGLRSLPR